MRHHNAACDNDPCMSEARLHARVSENQPALPLPVREAFSETRLRQLAAIGVYSKINVRGLYAEGAPLWHTALDGSGDVTRESVVKLLDWDNNALRDFEGKVGEPLGQLENDRYRFEKVDV